MVAGRDWAVKGELGMRLRAATAVTAEGVNKGETGFGA
jgi:hypothetical protein